MTLHVYEWFSYACNNSSDHRLVAEFETPAKAAAMAKELGAVFLANAKQAEAAEEDNESDWDPWDYDPSPALVAFGKKYGATFSEGLIWGDDGAFSEDLPEIATLGKQLYVYHGYMSGGFDGDLPRVLKKAGAKKVQLDGGPAWLKVTAKAKKGKVVPFQKKLDEFTNQRLTKNNLCDWQAPWGQDRLPIERDVDKVVVMHDDAGSALTLALGAEAKARTLAIGGKVAGSVSKTLDVLVIGDDGSPLYGDGAKGDKQRKAEALIKAGAKIRVISETAFLQLGEGEAREDGSPTKASPKTASKGAPKPRLVTTPDNYWTPIACGVAVANGVLTFVGGRAKNYMLTSKDGRTFEDVRAAPRLRTGRRAAAPPPRGRRGGCSAAPRRGRSR